METGILKDDKYWLYALSIEDELDLFSEAYQSEQRVIIPDHGNKSIMDKPFEEYCSTSGHPKICKNSLQIPVWKNKK